MYLISRDLGGFMKVRQIFFQGRVRASWFDSYCGAC